MAYIMLRGEPVFIKEIHTSESSCFKACYDMSYNGEIRIKIKSRCLEKALEFCELRPQTDETVSVFDRKFVKDVKNSGLNLIDLIHAAGMLGINRLVYMLFDDVVRILCKKTCDEVEKIFKARYNRQEWCFFLINKLLSYAPPCPSLSEEDLKEMDLKEILKVSPAHFTTLPNPQKCYWVYAHLLIKCNPAMFISITEDAAEDDQEEQAKEDEESKVPKANDDVGGPGPRGLAWKRRQPFDDMKNEKAYVKLRNKRVYIDKINSMESRVFDFYYYDNTFHGEIPIKIPKRYLGKAMEFCVERAQFQRKYTSSGFFVEFFDLKFLKNVKDSKIDLPELIHAAGRLAIDDLFRLLLNDVVRILFNDNKRVGKFFKPRYDNDDPRYCHYYYRVLDLAPPCPTLPKFEQEKMKDNRETILKKSLDQLKDEKQKLYWVYAHLVIKLSPAPTFYDEAEEDEFWP